MKKSVTCSEIKGSIKAPSSKSALQRLLSFAWLAEGETEILNPDYCSDVVSAMGIIEKLGASVSRGSSSLIINSAGKRRSGGSGQSTLTLDCGESGLAIRMFSPIVSLLEGNFELAAGGSLMSRPTGMITKTLSALGVKVSDNGGFPPVRICGPLPGGNAVIDGSLSSQILTGLLAALPEAQRNSELKVLNLKSRPYIDMTIELAGIFGCSIENFNYEVFRIRGRQKYKSPGRIEAEGDWSSAAFLLAAGALAGEVRVENLRIDSKQADRAVMEVLRQCGADIKTGDGFVEVKKPGKPLSAFEFDAADSPDLFPPLVALASRCRGISVIHGAERLKHKESDRETSLIKEFAKGGVAIESDGRSMRITGGSGIRGFRGDSHNDHRIAMALAVSALAGSGRVEIENAQAVAKSWPGFFEDLKSIGGYIDE
ncbi:MAG: 3-phosphoshikimate 1-carboxyvinyltransferase [Spirochaetia bacterium]|jgi:3-phosphoshikimate 1-carboxyvinyltransferase|nr:3-phosphoshikimate 1-carboxyvinyltransferase [Spirochaetia bacterium]